jgi:2-polyprenyl-3-methyl-5-hydroxy-6-metoxy-1,4-benzoquinol methylase
MVYLEEKIINIDNKFIDKKDFIQYLDNLSITLCKKKLIMYFVHHKNKIISNNKLNSSNKLIQLFFYNAFHNQNLDELFRLQKLLEHFVSIKLLFQLNKKFLNSENIKNIKDKEFIEYILDNINKNQYKKEKKNKNLEFKQICQENEFNLQYIALKYLNILTNLNRKDNNISTIKYLDIGCGNAYKTKKLANYLKLNKNQIYGTNIETWGPYSNNKSKINIHFEFIKNNKILYPDEHFDFISCIFNLHHVQNLTIFLKEVVRIIKKNGVFLLIEHDIYTDYDKIIINIQHMLYSALYDNKKNYIENPDYIYLLNKYEWSFLLQKYGLELIQSGQLESENEYGPRYDNRFYSFFIKK